MESPATGESAPRPLRAQVATLLSRVAIAARLMAPVSAAQARRTATATLVGAVIAAVGLACGFAWYIVLSSGNCIG